MSKQGISVSIEPAELYKKLCPVCQSMLEQMIAEQLKPQLTDLLLNSHLKSAIEQILNPKQRKG